MSVLGTTTALPAPSKPPIGRLAAVEVRKMRDTRSGFWLLVLAAAVTLGATIVASLITGGPDDVGGLLTVALYPMAIFLPIVGILGITAEFSQRTALQTFVWVPQRSRVILAKALAIAAIGVAGFLVCLVSGVVVGVATGAEFDLTASAVGQGVLFALLNILTGLGFGMLFGSPAVAIVVYFVAPTVIGILTATLAFMDGWADWLDPSTAWEPLSSFDIAAGDWGNVVIATLIWLVLPITVGWLLLRRREVS